MRLILALSCVIALGLPAQAEMVVYVGQGSLAGDVWTGAPYGGPPLEQAYTFEYSGPMRVSFEQLPFDCDGQAPGGLELKFAGATLAPGTWTDVRTGETGADLGGFWSHHRISDEAIPGCALESGWIGLGPASLLSYVPDPVTVSHSVDGPQLTMSLSVLGEHVGGGTVQFVGTRVDFALLVGPDTINLGARGKWITAELLVDGAIPVADIDLASLTLEGVPWSSAETWDQVLALKFPRQEVCDLLGVGMEIPVTLSGQLADGTPFTASDMVRVIDRGARNRASTQATYQAGSTARVEWLAIEGDDATIYDGYISTDGGQTWEALFTGLRGINEYSWTLDADMTGSAEVLIEAKSALGTSQALTRRFQIEGVSVETAGSERIDYSLTTSPNPFNPSTTICYGVREPGFVEITIYDLAGRRVKTLVSGTVSAGNHDAVWNGRDDAGRRVASGVYLYRLIVGEFSVTKRMVLLK